MLFAFFDFKEPELESSRPHLAAEDAMEAREEESVVIAAADFTITEAG